MLTKFEYEVYTDVMGDLLRLVSWKNAEFRWVNFLKMVCEGAGGCELRTDSVGREFQMVMVRLEENVCCA